VLVHLIRLLRYRELLRVRAERFIIRKQRLLTSHSVYETYYLQTFLKDHSPSTVAWIGSIQAFAQFSATLASGPLTDRYGPMVVVWPFSLLLVVAMMLTSLCTELYQFILCQGILLGVSCGLIFAPALAVIGHYFFQKRALAMSLASTGSPLGGIIFPIVLNNLIPSIGFGWAQRVCGFLSLALLLPAAVLLRPTSMRRKNSLFLLDAFAKPAYYLQVIIPVFSLLVTMTNMCLQVTGLFMVVFGLWTPYFYIATYGIEHGMSAKLANYLFAFINVGSFVGRVSGGFLAGWVGQFNVISISCYISSILIFIWLGVTSTGGLIVLATLFGASSGIIIALMMSTIAHTAEHPSKVRLLTGPCLNRACRS
jgi:MFS family permease